MSRTKVDERRAPVPPIHVVGIGLDGMAGLSPAVQQVVSGASLLVGSARHLSYCPDHPAERVRLDDMAQAVAVIRQHIAQWPSTGSDTAEPPPPPPESLPRVVVLASGDPLFFGIGRLLLAEFSRDELAFHPHLSSVQLAFSRIKLPWQDARLISAHGRSLDHLQRELQQDADKLAVLTDPSNTPWAIARLIQAMDRPHVYDIWVCEHLGGEQERVQCFTAEALAQKPAPAFTDLNLVVLHRRTDVDLRPLDLDSLPVIGIPDSLFASFGDRPGLMTKRELRLLILGELDLRPGAVVWDVGAGTGAVSVEAARLCPDSPIYAIEKTAVGIHLIQTNQQRFQTPNIMPVSGHAPKALEGLPSPRSIFIGGSGGQLSTILEVCLERLLPGGTLVAALTTLENLNTALTWLQDPSVQKMTQYRVLACQLSRSVPVGSLTRLSPINPVNLLVVSKLKADLKT